MTLISGYQEMLNHDRLRSAMEARTTTLIRRHLPETEALRKLPYDHPAFRDHCQRTHAATLYGERCLKAIKGGFGQPTLTPGQKKACLPDALVSDLWLAARDSVRGEAQIVLDAAREFMRVHPLAAEVNAAGISPGESSGRSAALAELLSDQAT